MSYLWSRQMARGKCESLCLSATSGGMSRISLAHKAKEKKCFNKWKLPSSFRIHLTWTGEHMWKIMRLILPFVETYSLEKIRCRPRSCSYCIFIKQIINMNVWAAASTLFFFVPPLRLCSLAAVQGSPGNVQTFVPWQTEWDVGWMY